MTTIIKFRPFTTHCKRVTRSPSIMHPLFYHASWKYGRPDWTSCFSGVEVAEDEKVWKMSLDLPGIKSNDLSVTTDGNKIQIAASRHYPDSSGEPKTVKKSRISKSFLVDTDTIDLSQIKANLADGVLLLSAPKITKPAPHQVPITTDPHADEEAPSDKTENLEDEFENVTLEEASPINKDESENETVQN
jgi:HSP20 family protein